MGLTKAKQGLIDPNQSLTQHNQDIIEPNQGLTEVLTKATERITEENRKTEPNYGNTGSDWAQLGLV